jgi:arsenate reductase
MAEGWLRHLAGDRYEAHSAGIERQPIHPLAVQAMAEVGIDISGHVPQLVIGLIPETWDYVITVCQRDHERCPPFSGPAHRLEWGLPDPPAATGREEDRLAEFRRTRDLIRNRITDWLAQPHG